MRSTSFSTKRKSARRKSSRPSVTFRKKFDPEDTVDQDELEERFGEIAESFDMVWNSHWNGYDYYKVGNRVVFWVPSNC